MTDPAEFESKDGPSELPVPDLYQYEPLPTREHTRVLVLEPGPKDTDDNENPLVGSIRLLDLCDANAEPFEAISYVWGSPASTHVILVDGRQLRITASLRDALLQTRLPDRPRTLWADAICIDQWDHTEKGHQVAAMGRIYKKSKRTLICLGVQYPAHAHNAASLIHKVNLMIENVQRTPNFSGDAGSFPFPVEGDVVISTDPHWELGWDVMVRQPWFERGWVVQEASLGPDACVLWASLQIGWTSILRVNYWLVYRGRFAHRPQGGVYEDSYPLSVHHLDSFARRHPEEARLFDENAQDTDSASTLTTLFETRAFELFDPRDRIYAFMALDTSDKIMANMQLDPDYLRPYLEIYHDFAVKYIEKTGDLDILSFIKHSKKSLASAANPDIPEAIPSWIPRWDLKRSLILPIQSKLGNHPKNFTLTEKGTVLRARGLILGSVEFSAATKPYCQPYRASLAPRNVVSLWSEVVDATSRMDERPYDGRQGFAFFDVLCPIRQFSTFEKWSTSRQDFAQLMESHNAGREKYPIIRVLAERIRLRGPRRFVILSRGYYGIAPPITQKGDVFALIYGSQTLSILRPAEGRPGHYKIVGPVYVESKTVLNRHGSNMMGKEGCRDWEEWGLTEEDINLC